MRQPEVQEPGQDGGGHLLQPGLRQLQRHRPQAHQGRISTCQSNGKHYWYMVSSKKICVAIALLQSKITPYLWGLRRVFVVFLLRSWQSSLVCLLHTRSTTIGPIFSTPPGNRSPQVLLPVQQDQPPEQAHARPHHPLVAAVPLGHGPGGEREGRAFGSRRRFISDHCPKRSPLGGEKSSIIAIGLQSCKVASIRYLTLSFLSLLGP